MESLGDSIRRAMASERPPAVVGRRAVPPAAQIMTKDLHVCRPQQHVQEAIELLLKHRISGAPVVEEGRRLVGILSEVDCLRVLASGAFHETGYAEHLTVCELMSTEITSIAPDTDLYRIAGLFRQRWRRLPVVEGGRLLGQVSRRDVLRCIRELGRRGRTTPPHP